MLPEATLLAAEGATAHQAGAESQSTLPSTIAIDLAPGTTAAQRARLVHRIVAANPDQTPGGTYELRSALAAAIINARQMGGQPIALALGLAVAAVASLALTVLSSVRRRRHELALLKALGMTRGQLRSVIAWQTTLTLLIAVAIGGPLGVAGGPAGLAELRGLARGHAGQRDPGGRAHPRAARPGPGGQPALRRARGPRRPDPPRDRPARRIGPRQRGNPSSRSGQGRPVLPSRGQARGPRDRTGPVDSRTTRTLGSTLLTRARPVRMYLLSKAAASVPSRVANRFTVLSAGSVSSE